MPAASRRRATGGALSEPWRWWGDSFDPALSLARRVATLTLDTVSTQQAKQDLYAFASLGDTARVHFSQKRRDGGRLGTVTPHVGGRTPTEAVSARWLNTGSNFAVQLYDRAGNEIADAVLMRDYHKNSQIPNWSVQLHTLFRAYVSEAESHKLLDTQLYVALSSGVAYGLQLAPVQPKAIDADAGAAGEAGNVSATVLECDVESWRSHRPDSTTDGIVADDAETLAGWNLSRLAANAENRSLRILDKLSDAWKVLVPSDFNDVLRGLRKFRRFDPVDAPPGHGMEIRSIYDMPVGAIYPLRGRPDTRRAVTITAIRLVEYPPEGLDATGASFEVRPPSTWRAFLHRDGYVEPVATILCVPGTRAAPEGKLFFDSAPEQGTKWMCSSFYKQVMGHENVGWVVESVGPDEIARVDRTPDRDDLLAMSIEMGMWELRSRSAVIHVTV